MTLSVADIAKKALDGVSKAISDAVHVASVSRETRGDYNPTTGAYATTIINETGRAVFDQTLVIEKMFPQYQVGPGDELVMLEGFTGCQVNEEFTINGVVYIIYEVTNLLRTNSVFYAIVREKK